MKLPPGADWADWRLLTSERLSIPSPSYLDTHYSFMDGANAHAVLDEFHRIEQVIAEMRKR